MLSIILYIYRSIPASPYLPTVNVEQGFDYNVRTLVQLMTTLHLILQWNIGVQNLKYTCYDAAQIKYSLFSPGS